MATERQTTVNLGQFATVNFKVVENFPPNSPFAQLLDKAGVQTTPQLARGYMPGSSIDLLNGNLGHVCDFKFIFPDLNSLIGELGLISPVAAIQEAIRNAKLKATNRLRTLIQKAVDTIRAVLNGIVTALGFDPTGFVSFSVSELKAIVREINSITKKIAAIVESVLEYVFLAQQIQQLINWIKTLPEKFRKLLQDCLTNFGNSIKQVANQIQSIPDQIANLTKTQIQSIASEFSAAGQLALDAAKSKESSSAAPDALVQALNQPPDKQAAAIQQYIIETTPSQESITANTTGSKMANTSSP